MPTYSHCHPSPFYSQTGPLSTLCLLLASVTCGLCLCPYKQPPSLTQEPIPHWCDKSLRLSLHSVKRPPLGLTPARQPTACFARAAFKTLSFVTRYRRCCCSFVLVHSTQRYALTPLAQYLYYNVVYYCCLGLLDYPRHPPRRLVQYT